MPNLFIQTFIKLFFLLTPFAVVSTFLSLTRGMDGRRRRSAAVRMTGAIAVFTIALYLFGNGMFGIFGITVDSFRIGAGALLFLNAISLVRGRDYYEVHDEQEDVAVVPLAMPVAVGPGTTGTLLVLGAEGQAINERIVCMAGLLAAVLVVGAMVYVAAAADRFLRPRVMSMLSKLTGLVLSALAAQLIFTGVANFMKR